MGKLGFPLLYVIRLTPWEPSALLYIFADSLDQGRDISQVLHYTPTPQQQ